MLQLRKTPGHLRLILDLSLSICSSHKAENIEGKSSYHKVRQLWALQCFSRWILSSIVLPFTKSWHIFILCNTHRGCETDLVLFTLQKKPRLWKTSSFALSQCKQSGWLPAAQLLKNTELLRVPQRHEEFLLHGDDAKLQLSFFCSVHELWHYTNTQ